MSGYTLYSMNMESFMQRSLIAILLLFVSFLLCAPLMQHMHVPCEEMEFTCAVIRFTEALEDVAVTPTSFVAAAALFALGLMAMLRLLVAYAPAPLIVEPSPQFRLRRDFHTVQLFSRGVLHPKYYSLHG